MKYIFICFLFLSSAVLGQSKLGQIEKMINDKKYEEAKKILVAIKTNDSEYASAQFYLGRIAFDKKDFDAAQDYFEAAVEANNKVANYHNWLGNTYGMIAQDANVFTQGYLAPKMKAAWENAIALDKKNLEPRWALIQYYTMAPSFMGGSFEKAREMANQIKKLNLAEGHRAMATIFLKEENKVEAEKELIAMAKADPNYRGGLGNFYLNQKQYEKAFKLFEDVVKENPDDYLTIYQIGRTSAISGLKLERGEECLMKYLGYTPKATEPSHAGAHMRLGQIYEKKGNKAEAKKYYQISLKADATMSEAKEGLERLGK